MAYQFHYTPTGTGVISGKEVLEQTEDAINDLGNTAISGVQEALDKAEQALTNSENAVDDAQTALNTANNAEGVAIQAQTDVGNLSGTVTNIGNRMTTAEGNITNLQGRMTTAEGNIGNLQGRMTTAETNIGNLQTAVSTAQATANSAQQTATTARQQSYVFRYSSTAVVPNSTVAYSTIDNTDNIKTGDKILDVDGKLFEITAVDTTNQTVTVGTALIDLALDANVVHTSGNETVGGKKTFSDDLTIYNNDSSQNTKNLNISSSKIQVGDTSNSDAFGIRFNAGASYVAQILAAKDTTGTQNLQLSLRTKDGSDNFITSMVRSRLSANGNSSFEPGTNDSISLGSSVFKWKSVYATNYYYGSNNVEFSTKFVTTDTAQTISGAKTFSSDLTVANTDTTANTPNLNFRNYKVDRGTTDTGGQTITFLDKNAKALTLIESRRISNGNTGTNILTYNTDDSNNTVSGGVSIIKSKTDTSFSPNADNAVTCGRALAKWSDVVTYKVNGLEPSSLSLPSGNANDVIDISSYISDLSGGINEYTASVNGWITITCLGCTGIKFSISNFWANGSYRENPNQISCMIPICKSQKVGIYIYGGSPTIQAARFIPCQGNV